ncbi:hypothetical protein PHYSODRAFT_332253 [Phytophthora sojae]|uniref:Ankyrin repeat protein n=1 Tax=Phytophthora sojae (strain P6497) TaxID=1094619 RepID=G4ZF34_PHYSP|nr:hypothetical protein PHYSODRAFT_332253 [Phytophthora sojae]EGZ18465.1 hypothetical protein PHYSODRAFT_332253 [Phytophthora sojae]|eukprot:XP_009527523.1 hypothetical protein PHYSODRAFT_332253 [Phytophthora sojae]
MDGAATRGRLDLVQGLAASRSEGCSAEAFVGAAANGHSAVLEWLIGHYPELYDPPRCFVAAAESGQADIVNLTRQQRWNPHVLRDVIGPAVEAAAANGRVHVLEALRPWPPNQTKAFMAAAAHGHTDVMEMFNCVDSTSRLSSAAVLRDVTECGDPAAIEWLIQRYDPSERAIDQMLRTAVWATVSFQRVYEEAGNSSYDVVELLLDDALRPYFSDPSIRFTVAMAAGYATSCGNVEGAKMVLSECDGAGAGHALCIAVEAKRIELVELCAGKSGSSYKSKALEQAAQGEQIAVLDALMNYLDETSVWRALEQLPSDTNVVVLEAIVKNRDPEIYPNNFAAAAERGLLGLVNCLQGGMDANSIRWALLLAAANDHAEVRQKVTRTFFLVGIAIYQALVPPGRLRKKLVTWMLCDSLTKP